MCILVQGEIGEGVTTEEKVWIDSKEVIPNGARIGLNSILAAGSVANCVVPDYSVIGGVPAKILKDRINTTE